MHLLRSGNSVPTFFDLFGQKEDDMTFSLGLLASRSERFLTLLIERIAGTAIMPCTDAVIRLQTTEQLSRGRTDVEIEVPGRFAAVLEAKRRTNLPTIAQLTKYCSVIRAINAPVSRLTAVTNTPPELARQTLPREVNGIQVNHLTWREVRSLAGRAREHETNRNKQLLDEFRSYLTEILGMEKIRSNMVYVLSLSRDKWSGLSFMDVVYKHGRYFYPVEGGGWPEPPNYVAYRYDGQLQSIHHVVGYDVFTNPRQVFAGAEDRVVSPQYCLRLGPKFAPNTTVKAGPKIQRGARVWVMLDTLFTCATISEALDETKRREKAGEDA